MHIVIPDDYQDVIRSLDCYRRLARHDVTVYHDRQPASADELATRFAEADALVLTRERTRIDDALLDRLPKLRLISQTGKVSGHLDLDACSARGIVVTEGRGSPVAPAELAWTLILNARRQLVPAIEAFRQGQWQVNLGQALAGQVLGIWGYGKIGQRLARYAAAFDMPVLVWGSDTSRAAAEADGHRAASSREAFFAEADILSLNLRLSERSRHGVTFDDLSRMKTDALLVNVSRAELIAPGALLRALDAGRPGSAAVDVYEDEPVLDPNHPLLRHPRVLATPHLGYVEKNGYELYFGDAFDNVLAFFAGEAKNVANPEALSVGRSGAFPGRHARVDCQAPEKDAGIAPLLDLAFAHKACGQGANGHFGGSMGTISKGTARGQKQGSVGIAMRLASVTVAGSLLSGCVAQVAHAVFSPVLDSASHALQTPESVGITPASWRGKSCKDLASSYDYMADVQRKTAASGDAHMAKVHGWQMDAIQQVRNEQHCLTPDNTASTASTAPPAPTASVPATSPNQAATDLGLTLQSPSPELVKALGLEDGKGAWVVSVTPGSPAARAGLKPMDVILDVAGQMVSVPTDVLAISGKMRAGYQAPLSVWRDHSEKSLTLSIPSGLMAAAAPATPPAPLPVAAPAASPMAATPDRLEYCYLYLTSSDYHKDPDVLSPVFRDASVNSSVQQQMAAMKTFVAKVNRQQPGIWQDFAYNAAQCNTNSGVCFAAAKPVFGPAQSVMLRCFASSAEAEKKRSADEVADPTATTLAMP